jgi:class 3 adenylate cyclase
MPARNQQYGAAIRLESQHDVSFPPKAVWPILSRTEWLNRSVGLPPVSYDMKPRDEGGTTIIARARMLGQELRWQEFPFEWSEPEFYQVRRIYETGPFAEARLGMELEALPGGGTRVVAYGEITPRHAMGRFLAERILGPKTRRDMRRVMAHLDDFLRGNATVMLPRLPVQPVNEMGLQSGLKLLRASDQGPELVQRLEAWLRESPDVELTHIRPFAVARSWRRDRWEVFRLFLHATRAGLLNLSWEILCPNCRTAREARTTSLSQLKSKAHCEVCDIRFDADFDKSVELKFTVNPAIRQVDEQTFCLAGPGGKPHVLGQLWLEPGEERLWRLPACLRQLRLHSAQVKERLTLLPDDMSVPGLEISCGPARFVVTRATTAKPGSGVRAVNPNSFPVLLSVEDAEWSDEILTAASATNWQEFRDLFANEVISPAEQVSVGSLVVLFTDLRGSTALYQGIGDAPAYVLVRNHFSILTEVIGGQHGAVVKTMGDAIMATFSRVDEALVAARQIHQRLAAEQPAPGAGLVLKSSLHQGPCLAVNANGRLDYFGTTVNLAARMVECCAGGDVCFSAEIFSRPETTEFLAGCSQEPESLEMHFRGFAHPHRVWRIKMV